MSNRKPPVNGFKKGVSGNPQGARLHNPVKRQFKKLTLEQLREVMILILQTHPSKLQEAQTEASTTTLKAWIAAAAIQGINKGDLGPLKDILDRVVGRNEEKISVDVTKSDSLEERQKRIAENLQKLKILDAK